MHRYRFSLCVRLVSIVSEGVVADGIKENEIFSQEIFTGYSSIHLSGAINDNQSRVCVIEKWHFLDEDVATSNGRSSDRLDAWGVIFVDMTAFTCWWQWCVGYENRYRCWLFRKKGISTEPGGRGHDWQCSYRKSSLKVHSDASVFVRKCTHGWNTQSWKASIQLFSCCYLTFEDRQRSDRRSASMKLDVIRTLSSTPTSISKAARIGHSLTIWSYDNSHTGANARNNLMLRNAESSVSIYVGHVMHILFVAEETPDWKWAALLSFEQICTAHV